ncbi:MAG: class I adenylate-forming enzyme family protein [Rubrivivax sp.]|nr:class I adenylate-forming enzyme family protein [Rubrivivax sp.]
METPPLDEFRDLPSLIAEHARRRPQAPALRAGEQVLGYAALNSLMDRVAAALQHEGLGPGDCIAICALPGIEYLAVFMGALRAGLAVAPLAHSATPAQLAEMAADAGARIVFTDATTAGLAVPWPAGARPWRLDVDLPRWFAGAPADPTPVAIDPSWPFNLIYSSGTTGAPKGIVQSHAMRWAHARRGALSGYGPDTVTLLATPMYSNTTLVCAVPTLAHGGCLLLMAKFDSGTYLKLAQAHRVTHTMLVPVQYQRLMARPDFADHDLSSFRYKFSTSAPFPRELKADVLARWPGALVEYYGLTEGGGTCILQAHLHPDKLHTVGQPAEGHDIRLIDEDGREIARTPGGASQGSGEVVGHSPAMMTGYHRQPGMTAEAEWFDATGRRFIRTGDVGRFDEDGFLVLHDRRKDMVISGGFNIYPSDLEAVLRRHPAVAEAAVIGVPSVEWGETPVACLVLKADAQASAEDLRLWANAQLGKTQRLAAVRVLPELPRSAIGKVLKRELREQWLGRPPWAAHVDRR